MAQRTICFSLKGKQTEQDIRVALRDFKVEKVHCAALEAHVCFQSSNDVEQLEFAFDGVIPALKNATFKRVSPYFEWGQLTQSPSKDTIRNSGSGIVEIEDTVSFEINEIQSATKQHTPIQSSFEEIGSPEKIENAHSVSKDILNDKYKIQLIEQKIIKIQPIVTIQPFVNQSSEQIQKEKLKITPLLQENLKVKETQQKEIPLIQAHQSMNFKTIQLAKVDQQTEHLEQFDFNQVKLEKKEIENKKEKTRQCEANIKITSLQSQFIKNQTKQVSLQNKCQRMLPGCDKTLQKSTQIVKVLLFMSLWLFLINLF